MVNMQTSVSDEHNDFPEQVPSDSVEAIWELLEQVKDPEIPVLSLRDLGVLRKVDKLAGKVVVTITPTYSGCPAIEVMREDIRRLLVANGIAEVEIKTVLSPAWTTDWMSAAGKEKLEKFGIAPPACQNQPNQPQRCPVCASPATSLISEFGSTACKAMYRCDECKESFCYFKVI